MNIEQFIQEHNISGNYRGDCPECFGKNTFSISEINGEQFYHCFRVSCGIRGRTNNLNVNNYLSSDKKDEIQILDYLSSPLQNKTCFEYLKRYDLLKYYSHNSDRIRYDPKLNRCVFVLKYENKIKGYTGRSLDTGVKWHIYSRERGVPFLNHLDGTAIIVEDCVSAAHLWQHFTGIALLGTSLSEETIPYLLSYDKVYVALDDDALNRAISIQRALSAFMNSYILPLRKDLKYYSNDELETLKEELV